MDVIKECFRENAGTFTEKLKAAGFSVDQARQFLPEIESSILDSVENSGVAKMITCLVSEEPSRMFSTSDINLMAIKLGMNSDQVMSGLEAIMPVMTRAFSKNNYETVGAVDSLA